ncbi:hypothetical protein HPP92_019339 [Vanilla planifolia]|uniref:Uncharacterized protein n=1 Tax=Vanilla planifolia TaxID=51239 RepID=A0A835ULL0_VANPL|nr:hypothetical protein HPP92_019339 [Vanilla planifolia]
MAPHAIRKKETRPSGLLQTNRTTTVCRQLCVRLRFSISSSHPSTTSPAADAAGLLAIEFDGEHSAHGAVVGEPRLPARGRAASSFPAKESGRTCTNVIIYSWDAKFNYEIKGERAHFVSHVAHGGLARRTRLDTSHVPQQACTNPYAQEGPTIACSPPVCGSPCFPRARVLWLPRRRRRRLRDILTEEASGDIHVGSVQRAADEESHLTAGGSVLGAEYVADVERRPPETCPRRETMVPARDVYVSRGSGLPSSHSRRFRSE